jgi:hypothetical protein
MDAQKVPGLDRSSRFQRFARLWRGLIGLSIALLVAVFFFSPIVMTALTTPIAAVGLDPLSTGLITALLLIAGAALTSAMLSRQRLVAVIGAGVIYSLSYIVPFLHQELLPHSIQVDTLRRSMRALWYIRFPFSLPVACSVPTLVQP